MTALARIQENPFHSALQVFRQEPGYCYVHLLQPFSCVGSRSSFGSVHGCLEPWGAALKLPLDMLVIGVSRCHRPVGLISLVSVSKKLVKCTYVQVVEQLLHTIDCWTPYVVLSDAGANGIHSALADTLACRSFPDRGFFI